MRAITNGATMLDGYYGAAPELRLLPFAFIPARAALDRMFRMAGVAALRPALLGGLRLGMGAAMGAAFGAAAGHVGLWLAAGVGLGAILNAVSVQSGKPSQAGTGQPPGPVYPVR